MTRQRQRAAWAWHILALLPLAGAACAEQPTEDARETGSKSEELASGWTKLPDPPLSGRVASLVATVGDTIVVSGGWDWLCSPDADCAGPGTPPYADGAAYDLNAGSWRSISDAPAGFSGLRAAVVGHDVYALSQCASGPTCPAAHALFRYRSDADEWDVLPGPSEIGHYVLLAVSDGVVAYRGSDEGGSGRDYRFLAGQDQWEVLPDDPLPPVYDRFVVEYGERLMLFGTPLGRGARTKLAAVYDPETDAWQELAESGTLGYQVWRAGPLLYLNPHFGRGGGGIYDPNTNAWRPLRDPPTYDLAGIIAPDGATYEYSSGWVVDARSGDWLEIAARPDADKVYDEVVAEGPRGGMVVFGGQSWSGADGRLVADTWLWSPPPASL